MGYLPHIIPFTKVGFHPMAKGAPSCKLPLYMNDPVYKLIELTGTSTTSIEDAVIKAIQRAHETVKHLCWFQVTDTRGKITEGKVEHWQVTIKVGFNVET